MSESAESKSETLFFLGAGASVAAGVPDTYRMVEAFQNKIEHNESNFLALKNILEILKKFEIEQGRDGKVDIA